MGDGSWRLIQQINLAKLFGKYVPGHKTGSASNLKGFFFFHRLELADEILQVQQQLWVGLSHIFHFFIVGEYPNRATILCYLIANLPLPALHYLLLS